MTNTSQIRLMLLLFASAVQLFICQAASRSLCKDQLLSSKIGKICQNIPIIPCEICTDHYQDDLTLCNIHAYQANNVLSNIPIETTRLVMLLDTNDNFSDAKNLLQINLTMISRLVSLKQFVLMLSEENAKRMLYDIQVNGKTTTITNFNMTKFVINIPLAPNYALSKFVDAWKHLDHIDLSLTSGLGLEGIKDVLLNVKSKYIEALCLKNVQTQGMKNYNGNMSHFFNNLTHFQNLGIQELDLSMNALTYMPPILKDIFPKIQIVDLSGNLLLDIENFNMFIEGILHPRIQIFNVSDQIIPFSFNFNLRQQRLCSENLENLTISESLRCSAPLFHQALATSPSINISELFNKSCIGDIVIPVGDDLKEVSFSYIHLQTMLSYMTNEEKTHVCFSKNNSLRNIYISGISKNFDIQNLYQTNSNIQISGLENLQLFNISSNNMNLSINQLQYWNLKSLIYLDISNNYIQINNRSDEIPLCDMFPKLITASLHNTGIVQTPNLINCTQLQSLDVSNNNLIGWNLPKHRLKIKYLSFKNTNLSILNDETMKFLKWFGPLSVDISDNILSCNCSDSSTNSIQFLKQYSNIFINYPSYICYKTQNISELEKVFVVNYKLQSCFQTYYIIWVVSSASVVSFLLVVCFILAYRFRWKIRYMWYRIKEKRKTFKPDHDFEFGPFKYDAFVSYCAFDRFWVHDILLKELESKCGFQLCIHYRDFPVGGSILETIVESIGQSRTVIVVLSSSSCSSEWMQFEIEFALRHCIKTNKQLIVIKLGSISSHQLSSIISCLLHTHLYISWPEEDYNGQKYKQFWSKVLDLLYTKGSDEGCLTSCCCSFPKPLSAGFSMDDEERSILSEDFFITDEEDRSGSSKNLTGSLELDGYVEKNLPVHLKPHLRKAAIAKKEAKQAADLLENLLNDLDNGIIPTWPFDNPSSSSERNYQNTQLLGFVQEYSEQFEDHNRQSRLQFAKERIDLTIQFLKEYKQSRNKAYIREIQRIELEVEI